jgi:hypothetical protein
MKRTVAALSLALMMIPFVGSAALAQDPSTIGCDRRLLHADHRTLTR